MRFNTSSRLDGQVLIGFPMVADAPTLPAPTKDISDPPPKHEPTCICLCCSRCDHVIATDTDLLAPIIPRLESASYPYQLELLGNEEAWVYSATNPEAHRFDVARLGGDAPKRVRLHRKPTAEHSFFPPLQWQMASCSGCHAHLGWAFSNEDEGRQNIAFLGLILTHLRERHCSRVEIDQSTAQPIQGKVSSAVGGLVRDMVRELFSTMTTRLQARRSAGLDSHGGAP